MCYLYWWQSFQSHPTSNMLLLFLWTNLENITLFLFSFSCFRNSTNLSMTQYWSLSRLTVRCISCKTQSKLHACWAFRPIALWNEIVKSKSISILQFVYVPGVELSVKGLLPYHGISYKFVMRTRVVAVQASLRYRIYWFIVKPFPQFKRCLSWLPAIVIKSTYETYDYHTRDTRLLHATNYITYE